MCLNDTYPFCQQPLSGNCHSICFSKPVLWTATTGPSFVRKNTPRREPKGVLCICNYLPMFICAATSAAKSSCFFSMPSPFSKRTAVHELDPAAQLLGGVGDIPLNRFMEAVAADELHLQQAVLLVELVHLAGMRSFPCNLRAWRPSSDRCPSGPRDLLLLGQHLIGDLGLVPEAGVQGRDLHGDVLADLGGVDAAVHSRFTSTPILPPAWT